MKLLGYWISGFVSGYVATRLAQENRDQIEHAIRYTQFLRTRREIQKL